MDLVRKEEQTMAKTMYQATGRRNDPPIIYCRMLNILYHIEERKEIAAA